MIITIILTVIFVLNLFVDMVLPVLPVLLVRGGGTIMESLSPRNFPLDKCLPVLAQICLQTEPLPGLGLRRQSWQRPPVVTRAWRSPAPVRLAATGVHREGGRVLQ